MEHPAGPKCTPQDNHNAILYEHNIIAQAALAVAPGNWISSVQFTSPKYVSVANMPPWVQQLYMDIWADIAPLWMDIKKVRVSAECYWADMMFINTGPQ